MPKGSRIVDQNNTVQDVADFYIALNGKSNRVVRALVADKAVSREFWPPTVATCNPLVLTTTEETSWDIKAINDPLGVPKAICDFDAATGRLTLSVNDGTTRFVQVVNPAPRATGIFVFRVDVISGNVVGSPVGLWTDVLDLGTTGVFPYSVSNITNNVGQELGSIDFSIAEDDGAGMPLAGTTVVKRINFIAELTGTNLTMTTIPWNLQCIKVQENAIVHVLTTPIEAEGEAFITGNECNLEVRREVYAGQWNPSFMVQMDVVSGTVPQGPAAGVLHTTDVRRTWFIAATVDGEDFTSVIDVTITDGTDSVTKRISIHVQRTDESGGAGDISPEFTRFDSIKDFFVQPDEQTPLQDTLTEISFLSDGTVTARTSAGPYVNFPQNWNDNAPNVVDPENFEIIALQLQGDDIPDGSILNQWLNLSAARTWGYEVLASEFGPNPIREIIEFGEFTFSIREVGRPETALTKRIFMQCGISPFEFDPSGDN